MRNLRLVRDTGNAPPAPPAPDAERDAMLELMHVYRSALVRARFLQRHDYLPRRDPADTAWVAIGGRFTRRPRRRTA